MAMEATLGAIPAHSADADVPTGSAAPDEAAAAVQHFDMCDDDEGEMEVAGADISTSGPGSLSPDSGSSLVADATDGPEGAELAAEVRERFRWLCEEDQKTVCRRECQLAQKKQEAMLRQLQMTVERYSKALEVAHAVASSSSQGWTEDELAEEVGLSPLLRSKYEDRIGFLQSMALAVDAESAVSLPRLTPLEQAKGFAFASYASTAAVANKLKDNTASAAPALESARSAFASFASRLSFGGGPSRPSGL
mmetsp:Transcript_25581/g.45364  ORF Transcript_25581/g.45364 Transcript_25581/m.45364 type:complete len:251 (+) Transcript_25581:30-782(+)